MTDPFGKFSIQGCKKPSFFLFCPAHLFFFKNLFKKNDFLEKNEQKMGFLNLVFSNFSLITKYKISYLPYFKFIVKD